MRLSSIGGVIALFWLIIGAVAAGQRGYFSSGETTCTKAATLVVTVFAGPLNYLGANPKVDCKFKVPQPSK